MNPSRSRQGRQKLFAWVVAGCIALAAGYTAWVVLGGGPGVAQNPTVPGLPVASPAELQAIQSGPHVIYLHQAGTHYGQVALSGLDPEGAASMQTGLKCDRVYYAAGNGICLIYDTSKAAEDPLAPIPVGVTLFGSDFQPRHHFTVEGIPSRTRISPDGKYAAYTVFVTGHGYMDVNMSTATVILDTATGQSLGNLEEFETWKDGQRFRAPEFNFWGVTFAQDSNRFYATLRQAYITYLVQGDVAARTLTVLHENVECPSLSPDGTRIAFKKLVENQWQLTVLDLATMTETRLAEKEAIDDQVEWLDNERVLYQKDDFSAPKRVSVFVVAADGSGEPEVFLSHATSPVVVH
jgi:hypothetical protein